MHHQQERLQHPGDQPVAGPPGLESYKTDPLCQAVERCRQCRHGGRSGGGQPRERADGISVYGGITVLPTIRRDHRGRCRHNTTVARSDDTIASYSSRGPTAIDGLIKPDIVAPGNKIIAFPSQGSSLFVDYPANRVFKPENTDVDQAYFTMSGTSMATPWFPPPSP